MIADTELLAKLREVADRQEIHQVLMRYSRGVDRQDEALLRSVFHPGAINDDGTSAPATKLARRVAELERLPRMHFIGNILIELEGDMAYAETYFIAYGPAVEDGKTYTRTRAGRWLDRFDRKDGEWKISHRVVIDEWARLDEVGKIPRVGGNRGVSGPDDPLYQIRKLTEPAR